MNRTLTGRPSPMAYLGGVIDDHLIICFCMVSIIPSGCCDLDKVACGNPENRLRLVRGVKRKSIPAIVSETGMACTAERADDLPL